MGLKSPDRPAKLTMSDSVTVRPSDSHSCPTCTSSKNRCAAVNDMASFSCTFRLRLAFSWRHTNTKRQSKLRFRHKRLRLAIVRVDADVHDLRFRHLQSLGPALGLDGHVHRD